MDMSLGKLQEKAKDKHSPVCCGPQGRQEADTTATEQEQ